MNNSTKTRAYSIISAVLFIVQALYQLISNINYLAVFDITFVLIMLAFAVVLFIGKKNISLIVISCVTLLDSILYLISHLSLYNVLYFLTYASLTAIIILGMKNTEGIKNIFFMPAAISLINNVIYFISLNSDGYITYLEHPFLIILIDIVNAVSLFFLGLWIYKQKTPNKEINTPDKLKSSLLGSADKLKACKELFDAGIITQEEFEEKKNQILNK